MELISERWATRVTALSTIFSLEAVLACCLVLLLDSLWGSAVSSPVVVPSAWPGRDGISVVQGETGRLMDSEEEEEEDSPHRRGRAAA